jgi:hypothetical protein
MATASTMADAANIIDAEFETVIPSVMPEVRRPASMPVLPVVEPSEGLSILRGTDPLAARGQQPDDLSPSFLLFTALAALAVFWVCGGRFLLY